MAFIQPIPVAHPTSFTRRHRCHKESNQVFRSRPRAPAPAASTVTNSSQTPRPRTSAPVIDLRVATRLEAHHWITVRPESTHIFQRAAVAQVDVTRQLEKRADEGALHRWVLREISSSAATNYIVMESFARSDQPLSDDHYRSLTRRWLSAVERVGPLVDAGDSRTLHYGNVFTAKKHDVTFDPNSNIVVLESHSTADAPVAVLEALCAAAEASVATGRCLEFCVLRSSHDEGLFKTVQVYQDHDAMKEQTRRLDSGFMHAVRAHTTSQSPSRKVFKPIVFA